MYLVLVQLGNYQNYSNKLNSIIIGELFLYLLFIHTFFKSRTLNALGLLFLSSICKIPDDIVHSAYVKSIFILYSTP